MTDNILTKNPFAQPKTVLGAKKRGCEADCQGRCSCNGLVHALKLSNFAFNKWAQPKSTLSHILTMLEQLQPQRRTNTFTN